MTPPPTTPELLLDYRRRLLWHGFFLMAIALVVGLCIPLFGNPRTGLAAHVVGLTSGLMLITVGFAFPLLRLSRRLAASSFWMLTVSLYAGFAGELVGAIFALTSVFTVTSSGLPPGPAGWEFAVEVVLKSSAPTTILPILWILYGLRSHGPTR